MLTYQLLERRCSSKNDVKPVFPNDVQVEVCFEPSEQFGSIEKKRKINRLSKTIALESNIRVFFDANTGKYGVIHAYPPFESIQQSEEFANLKLEMRGNKFFAKTKCKDFKALNELTIICCHILPFLLNLEFAEPTTVKYTRLVIGKTVFNWELAKMQVNLDITTKEKQEARVAKSFCRLPIISGIENRKLAAALSYFYTARRLKEAGNSPYEFMAEYVLNLDKTLRILFGGEQSYKEVRSELAKFGCSDEEIEERFIPVMILRNQYDVGHTLIKIFKQRQLNTLHRFLEQAEYDFKDLLERVIRKVEKGEYTIHQRPDLTMTPQEQESTEKLITSIERRLNKLPH